MLSNIKPYKNSDYPEVASWLFLSYKQIAPPSILLEEGTFILELDNVPALSLTVLLTQTKDMSYIFNFIKNPKFKNNNLEEYGQQLWNHCFDYAKSKGYKQIICFSENEKLTEKYQRFGMKKNLEHLTSFIKEL